MHAYIHAYLHTYLHTYKHTCIHTCIHAYMHTCIHTYIHTYMHTCIIAWYTHIYIYIYMKHMHITYTWMPGCIAQCSSICHVAWAYLSAVNCTILESSALYCTVVYSACRFVLHCIAFVGSSCIAYEKAQTYERMLKALQRSVSIHRCLRKPKLCSAISSGIKGGISNRAADCTL